MLNGFPARPSQSGFKAMLLTSSLLSVGWSVPATAQYNVPPPTQIAIDENDVNTLSGQIQLPTQTISIGPEEDPLVYEDFSGTGSPNFRLDLWSSSMPTGFDIRASVLNDGYAKSTAFFLSSGTPSGTVLSDGRGASLSQNGSVYTVTNPDGTKHIYGNADLQTSDATGGQGWTGRVTEIVRPDGLKMTLSYKKVSYTCPNSYCSSTGGSNETKVRLQSVARSDGYQLHFNYVSNLTGTGAQQEDWNKIASVVAFNQAADYCAPTADTCSFTKQWPTLSYQRNATNGDVSVTTPEGTAVYSSGYIPQIYLKYQSPGASSANVIVNKGTDWRVANVTKDGLVWNYAWTLTQIGFYPIVYQTTMVRTNPDGTTRTVVTDPGFISPTSITDEAGKTWAYTYDSTQRLTKATAPSGRYTSYTYDARGNPTAVTNVASPGSGLPDIVTSASYPVSCSNLITCNKPIWTKDAKGNQVDYTYDPTHGGLLTVTLPADTGSVRGQLRYSYTQYQAYLKNAAGSISASGLPVYMNTEISTCGAATSANPASCVGAAAENKTTLTYGSQSAGTANNLLLTGETIGAGDGSLSVASISTYDLLGNRISIDGPLAGLADTTVYRYDAASRPVGIVSPDPDGAGSRLPIAQRISYNARGQVAQIEAGTVLNQSDVAWAGFNSLTQTTVSYDANARPIKVQVAAGGSTYGVSQQSYDSGGRVKCSAIRMDPAQWSGQADACIPQTSGPNGPDRVTQTTYDPLGRVAIVSEGVGTADVAVVQFNSYTPNGRLANVMDAENNRTTYSYDGYDRLVKTEYPSTTKGSGTSNGSDYEQLSYDANGNVTSRRLRDGQAIGYSYDNLNRVTSIDLPNAVFGVYDKGFGYDLQGNLTSATMTNGWNNSFAYDALGRQVQENAPLGNIARTFDAAGRMTSETLPGGGLTVNYDYDVAGNATAVRENGAISGAGVLASYSYDNLGRRTGVTFGNGTSQTFAYDPVSRLSSLGASFPAATADNFNNSFTYNPASQIASTTRGNDSYAWNGHYNVDRSYGVNGLNQMTTAGATALGYDGRGNLATSGSNSFTYGPENLMATSSVGGINRSLAYDAMGRLGLIADTVSNSIRLDYAGSRLISERDWYGNLLRRYVHGPGTDNPIVWYEGPGTSDRRFLASDERGSVAAVTDSVGTLIGKNTYDEYGIPAAGNVGRFGYTGQTWIPELGMWYYKARMYSPTLGRFMQTDPIGYADGMNWYNYVGSDPVNGTDPTGLEGGGQQTIFQSIITVTGIRSISISGLSSMDISVTNVSSVGSVFGGIKVGDGVMFANKANPVSGIAGKGHNQDPIKVIANARKYTVIGLIGEILLGKDPGYYAFIFNADLMQGAIRIAKRQYQTNGRDFNKDWERAKDICPQCVQGNVIKFGNGAVISSHQSTSGMGWTINVKLPGQVNMTKFRY